METQIEHELSGCDGKLVQVGFSENFWEPGHGGWVTYRTLRCDRWNCKFEIGTYRLTNGPKNSHHSNEWTYRFHGESEPTAASR